MDIDLFMGYWTHITVKAYKNYLIMTVSRKWWFYERCVLVLAFELAARIQGYLEKINRNLV
ncbi:hypothetical protein MY31_14810 [Listeria monocytogenes]|nr:hypothetical protein [Listeria monocytogenes]EAD0633145.1 hypothetical protein [Listeria monocytogenes]